MGWGDGGEWGGVVLEGTWDGYLGYKRGVLGLWADEYALHEDLAHLCDEVLGDVLLNCSL